MNVFQNESEALEFGRLSVENRTDRISIYGSLEVTRDKAGLALAQQLKEITDAIVAFLERESLPDHIVLKAPTEKKNPFR